MPKVIFRKDGTRMVVYSRAELHDIMKESRHNEPAGIRAAERGR